MPTFHLWTRYMRRTLCSEAVVVLRTAALPMYVITQTRAATTKTVLFTSRVETHLCARYILWTYCFQDSGESFMSMHHTGWSSECLLLCLLCGCGCSMYTSLLTVCCRCLCRFLHHSMSHIHPMGMNQRFAFRYLRDVNVCWGG